MATTKYILGPNGQFQPLVNDFTDSLYKAAATLQEARKAGAIEAQGYAQAEYSKQSADTMKKAYEAARAEHMLRVKNDYVSRKMKTYKDSGLSDYDAEKKALDDWANDANMIESIGRKLGLGE